MTTVQSAAKRCGAFAIVIGLAILPAQATIIDQPDEDYRLIEQYAEMAEVEPGLTEFHEADDMPSYLAFDRVEPEIAISYATPQRYVVSFAHADQSVLAADGPGGLRWSILLRLALLSILCFAVAKYGVRRNA